MHDGIVLESSAERARVRVAGYEGVITPDDIEMAGRLGYAIKAIAVAERDGAPDDERVAVRVHPAMIPVSHPLAGVRDSFNAVFVEGGAVGDLMFYGRGAGGAPTASAVLGDLIDAAANYRDGASASIGALGRARIRPIDELSSECYVNMEVTDEPGVLAEVAGVFGRHVEVPVI